MMVVMVMIVLMLMFMFVLVSMAVTMSVPVTMPVIVPRMCVSTEHDKTEDVDQQSASTNYEDEFRVSHHFRLKEFLYSFKTDRYTKCKKKCGVDECSYNFEPNPSERVKVFLCRPPGVDGLMSGSFTH